MSQLVPNPLEDASELLKAANSIQGPSRFPARANSVATAVTTTGAISQGPPNPGDADVEFDFRPYLDNQYFEPGNYDDQMGSGSSAESFLPPQEFERLFSDPVKPALCPLAMMSVRDLMEGYPVELLKLPNIARHSSSGGIV